MTLGPQFWGIGGKMFHISPSVNRESIARTGLEARPASVLGKGQLTQAKGVYVSRRPHLFGDDTDVYEVDTSHLPSIRDDMLAMDDVLGSHFVVGSIPPHRIRRLEGGDLKKVDIWTNQDRFNETNPLTGEPPHRPTVRPEMQDFFNRLYEGL